MLNRPQPINQPVLQPGKDIPIKTDNISRAEIKSAIKSLKTTGIDNIPSKAIHAGAEVSVEALSTDSSIRSGGQRKSQMNRRRVSSLSCRGKVIAHIVRIGGE